MLRSLWNNGIGLDDALERSFHMCGIDSSSPEASLDVLDCKCVLAGLLIGLEEALLLDRRRHAERGEVSSLLAIIGLQRRKDAHIEWLRCVRCVRR